MSSYFDKVLVLYPGIQHVVYWESAYDGTPWADPYDGLVWENTDIKKPTKEELDAVTDEQLAASIAALNQQIKIESKEDLLLQIKELQAKVEALL